jgi:hypothetical protein
MLHYSALVAGLARNCAPALPKTLSRLDDMCGSFRAIEYIVVTNDSHDQTMSILHEWSDQRANVLIVCLDGLAGAVSHRTVRLSIARNIYLRELQRRTEGLCGPDLLVVADLDGVNSNLITGSEFERAIAAAPAEWGAIFANQRLGYYDIWALRHPTWSPDDCWARVKAIRRPFFFRRSHSKRTIAHNVWFKQVRIDPSETPIEVESAFGGFAIYRTRYLENAWYGGIDEAGNEVCEHVAFNAAVSRNGGRLFITPCLLNDAPQEHLCYQYSGGTAKPWLR